MARSKANNTVQVMEDTSMDRLLARGISKLAPLVPPWIVAVLALLAGTVFHAMWDAPAAAPWAAVGLTAGTLGLTGLTWLVSHERRGPIGRTHNTLTTLVAGAWITVATITGPFAPVTRSLLVGGSVVLALSWNIRHVIREHAGEGHGDALSFLFNKTKDAFGLDGAQAHTRKTGEHKIEATMALPAGEKTVQDVQKRTDYIESGMGIPPGAVNISADEDRADRAQLTVSDPRVMRSPIPWPGPSRPGASIAEPLRPAVWQDLDPVAYVIINHHLQIMGMTGAGKSVGGCWNIVAEVITRYDVAVLAADLTKGEQTLGPLRPGLHRFETSKAGVRSLIRDLHANVKPRTDYLSARGHQKWAPGCGLTYWLVWLEECPDIFDVIDMAGVFVPLIKAARSAGIGIVLSLQRSDYTQMPTIARGQLAKMCFGVADADDADFGLTDRQADRGARPELWENGQPGMAYLAAPATPDERIALPLRTYAWGDDEQANAAMRAHAEHHPATTKTVDEFTAKVMTPGGAAAAAPTSPTPAEPAGTDPDLDDVSDEDDEEEEDGDVTREYLHTDDPNPDNEAGPDDAIDDTGYDQFEFEQPAPAEDLTTEQARTALAELLDQWASEGHTSFASRDLRPLLDRIGRSRQWAQKEYKRLIAEEVIGEYDEDLGGYPILGNLEPAA